MGDIQVFNAGDLVVMKANATVHMRLDGPLQSYVLQLDRRDFADLASPSWATTRTAFVMPDEVFRRDSIAYHLLHRLWTKAVGTPGYDKREWKELEKLLLACAHG